VALAGLLARGGIVPFALPIVVLPTMTGLATALGPVVISIALGQPNADVARLVALVVGSFCAWLTHPLLGAVRTSSSSTGWPSTSPTATPPVAASADRRPRGRRCASPSEPSPTCPCCSSPAGARSPHRGHPPGADPARRSRVPLSCASCSGRLGLRRLSLAWLAGEAVGELAARGVVMDGHSAARALGGALADAARDIPATLATLLLGTIGLLMLVAPPTLAASVAWTGLRDVLLGDGSSAAALAGAMVLALAWLGLLVLAGIAATWRSAL
jgi:hypothetical protein